MSLFAKAANAAATTTTKKADKAAILATEAEFQGIGTIVQEYQQKALQLKNLEGEVGLHKDQILQVAKTLFCREVKRQGRNIGSFNLMTEAGVKVMIMPTDRYAKIPAEVFDDMQARYPMHVEKKVTYQFNTEVLERIMPALEKLIMSCDEISDDDKANLIEAKVDFSVRKGAIDALPGFEDTERAFHDFAPIVAIKNV